MYSKEELNKIKRSNRAVIYFSIDYFIIMLMGYYLLTDFEQLIFAAYSFLISIFLLLEDK